MTKIIPALTNLRIAFGLTSEYPLARMMAGFTGFAVAITLILMTTIPVQAERSAVACVMSLDGQPAPCVTD